MALELSDEDTAPATVRSGPISRPGAPHLCDTLFCVINADAPHRPPSRHSLAELTTIRVGRGSISGFERVERVLSLRIEDATISRNHLVMSRALGRWRAKDVGSTNGLAVNGAAVPAHAEVVLEDGDVLEVGRTFFIFRRALPSSGPLDFVATDATHTMSPAFSARLAELERVVLSQRVPIMIQGETGVGKEVAARLIHTLGRRKAPYVAINCGALSPSLVEAQLFGAVRGAFTGASVDSLGFVRAADGGALFLDEVGELPLESQPAFLRVLQEREVLPVGATKPIPVDIQLITATHRDLSAMVHDGRFRQDLLGRIAGHTLVVPPLRERREDIGLLVSRLMFDCCPDVTLTPEAVRLLLAHDWPHNVRELERSLRVASAVARELVIDAHHLPERLAGAKDVATPAAAELPEHLASAQEVGAPAAAEPPTGPDIKGQLTAALQHHHGNVSAVARELGKARMQIHRWLRRFDLDPDEYR